jgi:hypothetical protein
MRSIRSLAAARRFLATAVAGLALAAGLAASAPAAHAGGCTWVAITLVNGWHSGQNVYGTGNPSYCLEGDGMVYLSGSVAQTGNLGDELGTLPPSARPAHALYMITGDGPQDIPHVTVRVDPSGAVAMIIPPEASGSVFISLSGLSFRLGS